MLIHAIITCTRVKDVYQPCMAAKPAASSLKFETVVSGRPIAAHPCFCCSPFIASHPLENSIGDSKRNQRYITASRARVVINLLRGLAAGGPPRRRRPMTPGRTAAGEPGADKICRRAGRGSSARAVARRGGAGPPASA